MNCPSASCSFHLPQLLVLLLLLHLFGPSFQLDDFYNRTTICPVTCLEEELDQVCGNDGLTYGNRCEIQRAHCFGHPVRVKHDGPCPDENKCWKQRSKALQEVELSSHRDIFVPECTENGKFAKIQCHTAMGYCWCVNENGKPIAKSFSNKKKKKCPKNGYDQNKRRSSRGKRRRRGCTSSDRSIFNGNLVNMFTAEYKSTFNFDTIYSEPQETRNKIVIEWKFSVLDTNVDGKLKRKEFKSLQRFIRKNVKPKRCAKTFIKFCDMNTDRKISQDEWSLCLSVDINISFRLLQSLNSAEKRLRKKTKTASLPEPDVQPRHDESWDHWAAGPVDLLSEKTTVRPQPETSPDCWSERKSALDSQREGTKGLYIPECTPTGKFQKVQCFTSGGQDETTQSYCWCVDIETGEPLKGTSVRDGKPDCDGISSFHRPMPKCPGNKKSDFLTNLMDHLSKERLIAMANQTAGNKAVRLLGKSIEEDVAKWQFEVLDHNDNKVLDRREYNNFRKNLKQFPLLKKCGRAFPKYCDVNNDKEISMSEWLDCLGVNTKNVMMNAQAAFGNGLMSKRGPNPLSKFLKSD